MSKEFKTGIIVLVIIAIGIWGFNFLKGKDLFSPGSRQFFVEYQNINGLTETSMVTINGLKVGKIEEISFNKNPEKKGGLVVRFSVEKDFEFSKNSIAKIYSAGLMGGQNLAIIPNYQGDVALTNDYLKGEIESDMFSSVGEKLNPIQAKVENLLVHVDSLMVGLNQTLNQEARNSLNRSIIGFESTMNNAQKTLASVNKLLEDNKVNIDVSVNNTKKITDNFSKISEDLTKAEIGKTVENLQSTLTNVNALVADLDAGKGSMGKLLTDEKMYNNLTNASKELEELLREMKLNPKRFVHFSLFGKKSKPYNEETNNANISNN